MSATGVRPEVSFLHIVESERAAGHVDGILRTREGINLHSRDSSIIVNECFQTSAKHVFAAGDCCCLQMSDTEDVETTMQRQHWFQMRLWSQVCYAHMCQGAVCEFIRAIPYFCDDILLRFKHDRFLI